MKPIMKLCSSFSAAALLTSLVLTPNVFAEGQSLTTYEKELKKREIVSHLQERDIQPTIIQKSSFSALAAVNQAVYLNNTDIYRDHEYTFASSGGTFTVNQQNAEDIDYFIFDNTNEELVTPIDFDTYNLPAGNYSLIVTSYNEDLLDYRFELNGPFSGQPDVTLPSLQVTNPNNNEIRLSKDSSSTFSVKGNTDANYLSITTRNDQYDLSGPGSFSKNITLGKGDNGLYINALKENGNSISGYYNIKLPGLSRIAGKDRYVVSAGVSRQLKDWSYNTGTIVIARGDMYPDALSGGPLAAFEGAPVLLTATNSLPVEIQNQIKERGADRAIILGGTGSVSAKVESQLRSLGVTEIDRIGGKDRFVVSADTAKRVADYWGSDTAIIASGEVFPDALSASTIAGPGGMPILLVKSDKIEDPIQSFIKTHPEITNFIIVGGPATVKPAVETKLKELRTDAFIERIGGKDRYEVAINVANFGVEHFGINLNTLTFVRGDVFSDALSGAPLANYHMGPVLLTSSTKLEEKVNTFLQNNQSQIDNIYIVGGTGSVSTTAEQQLYGHIR